MVMRRPDPSRAVESAAGLSRREVLLTATITGAMASVSSVQVPVGVLTAEQKAAMIRGITDVVLRAMKQPPDPARRLFVQIFETAENGFGVNGQVFVPRGK
jgi:phenylpyruvate tautomerase PptA (4-oxalocrotonate tautomerase family)